MSRETGHIFGLGLIPEAVYGTPLAPSGTPKNYEQIEKEGYELANYTSTPVTNAGYSTGGDYPTKAKVSTHDVEFSFSNERMTFQNIGRRLLAAFGGYSVVPNSPVAGTYTHTFTPLSPQVETELPSFSYVEKIGEPALDADIIHDIAYPGAKIETFNLSNPASLDNGAFLLGSSSWRGSGKQLGSAGTIQTGSGVNFYKTTIHAITEDLKAENFPSTSSAVVNLYPNVSQGGTAVPLACDFRGFNFNHNNNLLTGQGYMGCAVLQDLTDPDSGFVRGKLPKGVSTTDLSLMFLVTKALSQGFNPMNRFRKQTVFSLRLTWTGGIITGATPYSLVFNANKLTTRELSIGSEDSLDTYSVTAETLTPGVSQPYSVVLVNNVPSYLTLV